MKNVKNDKADLEKKRGIFFQIGFIISCLLVLVVFEWRVPVNDDAKTYEVDDVRLETDLVAINRKQEIKPPMPKHFSKIHLIADEVEPDEEIEFPDLEIEPGEAIVIPVVERLPEEEEVPILFMSQIMPEFPGGRKGLQKYIANNIKYPKDAITDDIQGKVFVRFVIDDLGKVEQVSVIRSVHPLLDKEAVRIVESLPEWKPGSQNGKNVKVWYTVPIVFQLKS